MNIWSKLSTRLPISAVRADKANFLFQFQFSDRQLHYFDKGNPTFYSCSLEDLYFETPHDSI